MSPRPSYIAALGVVAGIWMCGLGMVAGALAPATAPHVSPAVGAMLNPALLGYSIGHGEGGR